MANAHVLFAVTNPKALEALTPHQRMIVQLVTTPTQAGERRCVKGLAAGLGVSPRAIYYTLEAAGLKLGDYAHAAELLETGRAA